MPKKKPHRRTNTGAADPLVPVSGSHLRAALEYVHLSNREAARRLADEQGLVVHPQTLDNLTVDPQRQRRCRTSVLSGLTYLLVSEGLVVPLTWLQGRRPLPFLPHPHVTDYGGRGETLRLPVPPAGLIPVEEPPAEQLARNSFLHLCAAAIWRDAHTQFGDEAAAWHREHGPTVLIALDQFLNAEAWQRVLLKDVERKALNWQPATVTLADAFRLLLEPWLAGRAALDLDALTRLVAQLEEAVAPALLAPGLLDHLRRLTPQPTTQPARKRSRATHPRKEG